MSSSVERQLFLGYCLLIAEGRSVDMITIRKAKLTDLDRMMEIYARAKRFMDSTGNTTQWEIGYPTRKMIQDDIENGYSFVCMGEDNIVHAAFKFFVGEDPTYRVIEQGRWKNDNTYGTIHRVASDGTVHNILGRIMDLAKSKISHIRIDTHENNKVMQRALEKQGFERCGIIYVPDGTPRIAFEWGR